MILNAIALLPELTIPAPSVNDDAYHYLFIQRASEALANGDNIIDHWLPSIENGFPQFLYYQHLPALAVVGVERLSFGNLDLLTSFNLVRYILLVALPLTVFVSMRWFGFSTVAAALAAAVSTLLSSDFRYGFEYDSYVWRGLGVYTQLWAMHLSFLTLAALYQAIQFGKRLWVAALLLRPARAHPPHLHVHDGDHAGDPRPVGDQPVQPHPAAASADRGRRVRRVRERLHVAAVHLAAAVRERDALPAAREVRLVRGAADPDLAVHGRAVRPRAPAGADRAAGARGRRRAAAQESGGAAGGGALRRLPDRLLRAPDARVARRLAAAPRRAAAAPVHRRRGPCRRSS